jgi:wobble nucleotide-excising tRNase
VQEFARLVTKNEDLEKEQPNDFGTNMDKVQNEIVAIEQTLKTLKEQISKLEKEKEDGRSSLLQPTS